MSPATPPPGGNDPETPDEGSGLPPEIEELLRGLTGGAPLDPRLVEMLRSSGVGQMDPAMLGAALEQVRAFFTSGTADGSVSVDTVRDVARKVAAAAGGDLTPTDTQRAQIADAVRVADLWLDEVTGLTASGLVGRGWSRAEWIDGTLDRWLDLISPVMDGVASAVSTALSRQLGQLGEGELPPGLLPPGMNPAAMLDQMSGFLKRIQGSMFSMQFGRGIGILATELVSGTEVSLPLTPGTDVVLMPGALAELAEGLGIDEPQVRLFLATREAARVRLFDAVPWLAGQLLASVRAYAHDISFDTDAIEEGLRSVDPTDAEAIQEALAGKMFASPANSPTQAAALRRLEASLALVEGWVDVVSIAATRPHLPQVEALAEAVRRRRATGGPAEKTFAALVGLELRPRRLRDAANLFAALEDRGGAAARDGAWRHPDLAPGADDLDDPLGYVERTLAGDRDEMDAALDALLRDAGGAGGGGAHDEAGAHDEGSTDRPHEPDEGRAGDGPSDPSGRPSS